MGQAMQLRIRGRAGGLRGTLEVPGDKSVTHRALLLGAMASGTTRLRRPLRSGVTEAMDDCLGPLGVRVEHPGPEETLVHGAAWRNPDAPLDCRGSGTTLRLLLGALAGSEVEATLTGSPRLRRRPMARVTEPLRRMGTQVTGLNGTDQPPLHVRGARLHGISYRMPVASAQVKSAILLAGLHAQGSTRVHEPVPSRDHTERLLRHLGVPLVTENGAVRLEPIDGRLPAFDLAVPGDFSAACFLLAAAVLTPGSEVTIQEVGLNPTRTGLLSAMRSMGARIEVGAAANSGVEPTGEVTAQTSALEGIRVDAHQVVGMIDEIPLLILLATQARGRTSVAGASELRRKESDRLTAMTAELSKMGALIREYGEAVTIEGPTPLRGAEVSAHGDHRVAMALAIAGTIASGETLLSDAQVIQDSYPGFAAALRSLGADLQ
jgi:3-phosphoshikimate 1-carboxyvinyltransferase